MNLRKNIRSYFWLFLAAMLVACQIQTMEKATNDTQIVTSTLDLPAVLQTSTPAFPSPRYEPTITPFERPTPKPTLPKFPLDGYVMAFLKDGDLYFQDGVNFLVKLTHIGETPVIDREKFFNPQISSDNKKIFFQRLDDNEYAVYTINTDGTEERAVFSKNWLNSLVAGTEKHVFGFIPDTYQMLFVTYLCKPQEAQHPCSVSLFITDTNTGEIGNLTNFEMPYYQPYYNRNIQVSPNGKMVVVGTKDGMDIFDLEGNLVRENILPYKPATGEFSPLLFWTANSSELIMMSPDKIYDSSAYENIVAYTVWRYSIGSNVPIQIPMDIPPMAREIEVSPDRKWGLYGGFGSAEMSLYLGDLITGHVQVFGEDGQPFFSWSPDSRHFNYGTALQNISSVNNPFSALTIRGFGKWIDVNHFTCVVDEVDGARTRMAEIDNGEIEFYDLGFDKEIEAKLFIKKK